MKPAPRIKLEIMTDCERVEHILSDFAHDLVQFASIITFLGGAFMLAVAYAAQPVIGQ